MDDGIAAGKSRERLRAQQAMGIGNRANGSHHARDRLSTRPAPTGSGVNANTIGTARVALSNCSSAGLPGGENNVRRAGGQFRRMFPSSVDIAAAPAVIDPYIAPLDPAQLRQRLHENGEAS